ncbi:MAG: metallophosphoesterase [Patescibacteria group bacterium]|jgi:UDP-2,3-diacylglucosamine pyrophosphatase LpxH
MKKTVKNSIKILSAIIIIIAVFSIAFVSYNKLNPASPTDPFTNKGGEKNMIVVLSDLHLGADISYAEFNKNTPSLQKLLKQISTSPNVKELVIAGDLLDEWFVPATINTYAGKDQRDFVQRIAATNKGVINAFNSIIQDGKILVTYVPGNHDLTITAENIDLILPGINQVRDKEQGLGTYSPADYPKIAIEHGHRYNFFCAPDPISNQDIAPGTIMPPGYFFTRIAALHVLQKYPQPGDTLRVVTPNTSGNASQDSLFAYFKLWEWAINYLPIENKFNEKIIVTNVNGFTKTYAVNDLIPYQLTAGGKLNVNLFKGIQDTWNQRQVLNHVAVNIPVDQAIAKASSAEETDNQAKVQYFMNPNSDKRIVIFGHTHVAKISSSNNYNGQKSIYANSGTWIDHNPNLTTMNFIVITPQDTKASSQTYVKLYNFEGEVVTKMAEDSLHY